MKRKGCPLAHAGHSEAHPILLCDQHRGAECWFKKETEEGERWKEGGREGREREGEREREGGEEEGEREGGRRGGGWSGGGRETEGGREGRKKRLSRDWSKLKGGQTDHIMTDN